jgi:uncharacterized membrane protein YhaH (DUF805 family)
LNVYSVAARAFSRHGGIRRLPFLGCLIALLAGVMALRGFMPGSWTPVAVFLLILVVPLFFRLKNTGMNPWGSLVLLIPFVGLIYLVRGLAYQEGFQDTGKLDKIGRIIDFAVVGGFVLLVVSLLVVGSRK